jgi:hypothetical protein
VREGVGPVTRTYQFEDQWGNVRHVTMESERLARTLLPAWIGRAGEPPRPSTWTLVRSW